MRIFLWYYEALFLVFPYEVLCHCERKTGNPKRYLYFWGIWSPFTTSEKRQGDPAVSYFSRFRMKKLVRRKVVNGKNL